MEAMPTPLRRLRRSLITTASVVLFAGAVAALAYGVFISAPLWSLVFPMGGVEAEAIETDGT